MNKSKTRVLARWDNKKGWSYFLLNKVPFKKHLLPGIEMFIEGSYLGEENDRKLEAISRQYIK